MKITFKRKNGEYIVSVNGLKHIFGTSRDALEFIFNMRAKETENV